MSGRDESSKLLVDSSTSTVTLKKSIKSPLLCSAEACARLYGPVCYARDHFFQGDQFKTFRFSIRADDVGSTHVKRCMQPQTSPLSRVPFLHCFTRYSSPPITQTHTTSYTFVNLGSLCLSSSSYSHASVLSLEVKDEATQARSTVFDLLGPGDRMGIEDFVQKVKNAMPKKPKPKR